jgi:hypothetical protein
MRLAAMQKSVSKWVNTRFGNECLLDRKERAMRVVEEAMELAQSVGLTYGDCITIAGHVFARPAGEVAQEHAGVMVSLLASATANGFLLEDVTKVEIERIWAVPLETILEKQKMKNRAGITKYGGEGND